MVRVLFFFFQPVTSTTPIKRFRFVTPSVRANTHAACTLLYAHAHTPSPHPQSQHTMDAALRGAGAALQPLMGGLATLLSPTRPRPKPVTLPVAPTPAPPSSVAATDAALDGLVRAAPKWATLPLRERAALLRQTIVTAGKVRREE